MNDKFADIILRQMDHIADLEHDIKRLREDNFLLNNNLQESEVKVQDAERRGNAGLAKEDLKTLKHTFTALGRVESISDHHYFEGLEDIIKRIESE